MSITQKDGTDLPVNTSTSTPQKKSINLGFSIINSSQIKEDRTRNKYDEDVQPAKKSIEFSYNEEAESDEEYNAEMEISEKFRILAKKELEFLNLKTEIKKLIKLRNDKEFKLNLIKKDIEKSLLNNGEHGSNITDRTEPHHDKSWFAKPLNFIHQLDNMLYNENEAGNESAEEEEETDVSVNDTNINIPIKSLADDNSDVYNTVSNNFWSFVHDVKTNLLVDETPDKSQSLQIPRSPSISKRQSYGRKRSSSLKQRNLSFSNNTKGISTNLKNLNLNDNEITDELWDNEVLDI